MEDRFLFRAKRIDNGEWVWGSYYEFLGRLHIFKPIFASKKAVYEVDPSTICQCTGLKDKSGRLIFENDIMEAHLDDKFPEDVTRTRVVWDKNAWVTSEPGAVDRECLDDFDTKHFYVVGNIFDNPELLEV